MNLNSENKDMVIRSIQALNSLLSTSAIASTNATRVDFSKEQIEAIKNKIMELVKKL